MFRKNKDERLVITTILRALKTPAARETSPRKITLLGGLMGMMLLAALAVVLGLAAPAYAEDFHFHVVATDFDHDAAQFSIEDEHTIKVNGSDQVSWEVENSTATISAALVRAAPRIHTQCTDANRTTQSQQIWRMTHHATVVVVMPGSCLWNRGKHDHIMMGFPWDVVRPVILVGDNHHRYRHGFSLYKSRSQVAPDEEIVGKVTMLGRTWLIVRKCRNFIGGPVDVYVPSAVQVHFAQDIKKHGKAVATTHVDGTVTFNITCPNGANFNTTLHTWADGRAVAEIDYTERTRVSVMDAHSASLSVDSEADGEVSATSRAGSELTVDGSCGDNPGPNYSQPGVDVTPVACVQPGQTRDVDVTVSNPNAIDDTAKATYRGQVYTKAVAAHGQVTFTFANQAAGTYNGTVLLVTADKSKSFTVTVEECPPPTDHAPQISCVFPAHVYVGGNVYLWCESSDSDGDAMSVNIAGDNYAHVSGVIPSDVRWDGTACPSGKSCWRATLWGDAVGTAHVVATVTANGKSATSAGDVPIKTDEF